MLEQPTGADGPSGRLPWQPRVEAGNPLSPASPIPLNLSCPWQQNSLLPHPHPHPETIKGEGRLALQGSMMRHLHLRCVSTPLLFPMLSNDHIRILSSEIKGQTNFPLAAQTPPISGEDQPPGDLYPPLAIPSDTFTPTRGECHRQVDSVSRAAHCWEGNRTGLPCPQVLDACVAAGAHGLPFSFLSSWKCSLLLPRLPHHLQRRPWIFNTPVNFFKKPRLEGSPEQKSFRTPISS